MMKASRVCETCRFWTRNQRYPGIGECEVDMETKKANYCCSQYELKGELE